ncbi:hypothetical protein EON62_03460, partial [archaeon]
MPGRARRRAARACAAFMCMLHFTPPCACAPLAECGRCQDERCVCARAVCFARPSRAGSHRANAALRFVPRRSVLLHPHCARIRIRAHRSHPLAVPSTCQMVVRAGVNPADPMFPPYLPGRLGGATLLGEKTVSMSASQSAGMHYNLHNMYGWSEGVASVTAMESIRGKRGMIISRSTFPTSGQYVGHWLGDNAATWDDLYYSIPGVLTMNMLGIPLVGADTCGFGGPATTPELCTRRPGRKN